MYCFLFEKKKNMKFVNIKTNKLMHCLTYDERIINDLVIHNISLEMFEYLLKIILVSKVKQKKKHWYILFIL